MAFVGSTLLRLSKKNLHSVKLFQKQHSFTNRSTLQYFSQRNYHKSRLLLQDEAAPAEEAVKAVPLTASQKKIEKVRAAKDISDIDLSFNDFLHLPKAERKKVEKLETDDIFREIKEDWVEEIMEDAPQDLMLSDSAREEMYDMHINDPVKYTINELALLFGCRPQRVAGILMLMQHRRNVEIALNRPSDPAIQNMVELNFAEFVVDELEEEVEDVMGEETIRRLKKLGNPVVDGEIDEVSLLERTLNQSMDEFILGKKYNLSELPEQAPPKYPDSVVLSPATRTEEELQELKRKSPKLELKNFYVVNTDADRNDTNREIIVFQPDGTIRTATWKERRDILVPEKDADMHDLVEKSLGPHYRNRPENAERVKEELAILASFAEPAAALEQGWRNIMKETYDLTDQQFENAEIELQAELDREFQEMDEKYGDLFEQEYGVEEGLYEEGEEALAGEEGMEDEDNIDEEGGIDEEEELEEGETFDFDEQEDAKKSKESEYQNFIAKKKQRAQAQARDHLNKHSHPDGAKLHSEAETVDAKTTSNN